MSARMRRHAGALAAGALLAAGLAGCADDEPPGEVPPAADPWNPCDGLSAARVSDELGQQLRKETGTGPTPTSDPSADPSADDELSGAAAVRCALLPVREGDATFEASYLLFDGGLDAAWETMGELAGRVTRPDVPDAEAARLVVNETRKALLITGFVETGDLIQSVNAVDPRPYDRARLVAATEVVLAELASHAAVAGVADDDD